MIIDEIDLKILYEFLKLKDNEYTSTWKIMKKIFKNGRDNQHMTIKRRIERMSELFIVEGKPKIYTLISDKVYLKKIKFPDKISKAICIKLDKWEVFEI